MKRILSIIFIASLLLTGCASSGKPEANSLSREEPVATTMEKQELTADSGNLPEWLTPYTALGELPAPTLIHISRENPEFSVNEHIAFPVCSVLCVTKDVAGTDLTLLNMNSDEIAALVEKIEKASVISEEEAVNPDAHLLGYEFSIVLRAADGNYMLTKMSAFDDGRVNITIEDGETSQALWVKSQTLIEKMQQLADYAIRLWNVIDYDEAISYYGDLDAMLRSFHDNTGSDYEIKEDRNNYSDAVYQECTRLLLKEGVIKHPNEIPSLSLERKRDLAELLHYRTNARERQIEKYLHIKRGS